MRRFGIPLAAGLAVSMFLIAAVSAMVATDRGLPTANLNNNAGADRSNVAWSFGNDSVTGDDFTVGEAGETWVVTGVTTWQVGTLASNTDFEFGDRYDSVTLYGGPADPGGISPLVTGTLAEGSSANSNPDITHTRANYADADEPNYEGTTGNQLQLWETTFSGLSWTVEGGVKYNFAADGTVRASVSSFWFNHASNAALSGSPQAGADGLYLAWDKADLSAAPFECDSGDAINCGGWDKSSDINVVVTAVKVATDANDCKNGGWSSLVRLDGTSFKNQGDCVSYAKNGR